MPGGVRDQPSRKCFGRGSSPRRSFFFAGSEVGACSTEQECTARLRADLGDDVGGAGGGSSVGGVVMICAGASLALTVRFGFATCPLTRPVVYVGSEGEGDGHACFSARGFVFPRACGVEANGCSGRAIASDDGFPAPWTRFFSMKSGVLCLRKTDGFVEDAAGGVGRLVKASRAVKMLLGCLLELIERAAVAASQDGPTGRAAGRACRAEVQGGIARRWRGRCCCRRSIRLGDAKSSGVRI